MNRRVLVLLIAAPLVLAACGLKGRPQVPEGSTYPRTYPPPESVVPAGTTPPANEEDAEDDDGN